jgi:hypothetical protein
MAHVTIEYMIFVPVLILQIIAFPIAAASIMNAWSDSRMALQLQEISSDLGSSMQQLYYTMNHESISSGTITTNLNVPITIQDGNNGYNYLIRLTNATNSGSSVMVLNLTLSLIGAQGTASSIVTLGSNASWPNNSTFTSSEITQISANKTSNTITLTFQGGA